MTSEHQREHPRRFAGFVLASGLTNLADGIATVAWAWAASLMTRDPLLIAAVAIALRLPWFLCAIPAGIITDRMDRKKLILRMDILRGVAFAGATLAIWTHLPLTPAPASGLTEPALYAALVIAALTVGVAEVFRDNAAQTMLPAFVPHERLERANGQLWSVEMIGNTLIGPALGALLIAAALPLPFAANALAYCVAAILILRLRGKFAPERRTHTHWRADLREALAYLAGAPLLRVLAIITGIWNLLFQMVTIALVLHAQENLHLGARGYGLVLSAGAIGGIAAGILGARIITRTGPARAAQWSLAASAIVFAGIAVAPGPVLVGLSLALSEFSGIVWNTVSVSYRQRSIPNALLGRVNSIYRLLAWGMMPVGLILSGLIVRMADGPLPRSTALMLPFHVAAVGALALAVIGWRALGRGFR